MGLPFHPLWLILILAIILIIFGPGKLPEVGGAVGRGIREFRKATSEITDEVRSSMQHDNQPPAPTAAPGPVTSTTEPVAETDKKS